jgi:glutathione synthase/RimK-type ligase-like ATP-grasp enzyme
VNVNTLTRRHTARSEVAFVTYQLAPGINEDDRLVADELHQRGIKATPAIWDARDVDWSRFDGVIIRSAWDYHLKPSQYDKWLENLAAAGTRLWNPPNAVRWNMNKRYLTELADWDVPVVPTMYQPAGEGYRLQEILKRCAWEEVVIKPAISASAHGTWRTSLATAEVDQAKFVEQVRGQDILIQPYVHEVADQGEWSFVFFDKHFSHAVLKRPAKGDFRVQREFGGNAVAAAPAPALVEQAQAIVSAVDHELLYARVDAIERAGRLVLMELEINEPFLFVGFSAGASQRFAEAIIRNLASKPPGQGVRQDGRAHRA